MNDRRGFVCLVDQYEAVFESTYESAPPAGVCWIIPGTYEHTVAIGMWQRLEVELANPFIGPFESDELSSPTELRALRSELSVAAASAPTRAVADNLEGIVALVDTALAAGKSLYVSM